MTEPSPAYKATHATYPDAPLPTEPESVEAWETVRRMAIGLLRLADTKTGRKQTLPERTR